MTLNDFESDYLALGIVGEYCFFGGDEAEELRLRGQLAELPLNAGIGDILTDDIVLSEPQIFVREGSFEVVDVLSLAGDQLFG